MGSSARHLYLHSAQAGTDYIFTRGPLGYFSTEVYDPELFSRAYSWDLISSLVFALCVVRFAKSISNPILAIALILVAILADTVIDRDNFYSTIMLLLGLPWLIPPKFSRSINCLAVVFIAFLSLMKFTYFVQAMLIFTFAEVAVRSLNRAGDPFTAAPFRPCLMRCVDVRRPVPF